MRKQGKNPQVIINYSSQLKSSVQSLNKMFTPNISTDVLKRLIKTLTHATAAFMGDSNEDKRFQFITLQFSQLGLPFGMASVNELKKIFHESAENKTVYTELGQIFSICRLTMHSDKESLQEACKNYLSDLNIADECFTNQLFLKRIAAVTWNFLQYVDYKSLRKAAENIQENSSNKRPSTSSFFNPSQGSDEDDNNDDAKSRLV